MTPALVVLLVKFCLPPPTVFPVVVAGERSLVLGAEEPLTLTLMSHFGAKHVDAATHAVFLPALAVDGRDLDERDPQYRYRVGRPPFRIAIAGDVRGARWIDGNYLFNGPVGGSIEPASPFEAYARAWADSVGESFTTFTSNVRAGQLAGDVDILASCPRDGSCNTYVRFRGREVHRTQRRVHGLLELADGRRYLVTIDAGFALALFELPVTSSPASSSSTCRPPAART